MRLIDIGLSQQVSLNRLQPDHHQGKIVLFKADEWPLIMEIMSKAGYLFQVEATIVQSPKIHRKHEENDD